MISATTGPSYYVNIEGMDARADWLFGPGVQDYLPYGKDTLIPFIMRLHEDKGVDFLLNEFIRDGKSSPIFIASYYIRSMKVSEYFTAISTKEFFDKLAERDGLYEDLRTARKEIRLGAPLPTTTLPNINWKPGDPIPALDDPPIGPPDGSWLSGTVVVGIIDDGIAFAHERFRTSNHGTRVQCFWRMDPPHTSTTVERGREICKLDDASGNPGIDTLLSSSIIAGSVEENQLYLKAGLIDFAQPYHKAAAWRVAHGTHVLDLAAGEDPAHNVLNRPIVAVQLPTATTADTSGADLYSDVHRAVDYILQRADAMGGGFNKLPVVINFSYGLIAGPHDGTSELEQMLNDRVQARSGKLRIVLPAGNSHLSRCHAEVRFASLSQVVELHWRVEPDDDTPSFLEIWLPHAGPVPPATDRIRLCVEAPGGAGATSLLNETDALPVVLANDGEVICAAQSIFRSLPTERRLLLVVLQPTARLYPTSTPQEAKRIAPPGVWTVRLHNVALTPEQPVQAWIQRDDTPYGYPIRGRQSYFDERCYVRFNARGREIEEDADQPLCVVKRAASINAIATGAETLVAGGYLRKELRLARYSAGEPITPPAGGTLPANLHRPDATLVSDDSKVHSGVLAAGSRSGSRVAINGTSVAAPTLARWVADNYNLATGTLPDRAAVCAKAQADETTLMALPLPPALKPPLPPERGGCGRMLRDKPEYPRDRCEIPS
jgi:hypothetical protein